MKIVTILGARPQIIKAAMVSQAIRRSNLLKENPLIREVVIHTGQHYDAGMSKVFFQQLGMPPADYDLGIANLGHGAMTGRMLEAVEKILKQESPTLALVYGDTNSTLAGALVASKLHVPVAHVEAGLRSFHSEMPEEVNRILTDRISSLLLCPTSNAVENLEREGYPFPSLGGKMQHLTLVGDVMYDAVLYYRKIAYDEISLDSWSVVEGQYALCTLHRQENTDEPRRLLGILDALRKIAIDLPVLLPLHPRTRIRLNNESKDGLLDGLQVIEPVGYLEMQRLEMSAKVILTDSGGIQKEAFFHGVPCITLREETEWIETVESGWNRVVGSDTQTILSAYSKSEIPTGVNDNLYGDGTAANSIVSELSSFQ